MKNTRKTLRVDKRHHIGRKTWLIGAGVIFVALTGAGIGTNLAMASDVNNFVKESYVNEHKGSLQEGISENAVNSNKGKLHRVLPVFKKGPQQRFDRFYGLYTQQKNAINSVTNMVDTKHKGYFTDTTTKAGLTKVSKALLQVRNMDLYTQERNIVDDISSKYNQTNVAMKFIDKQYGKAKNEKKVRKTDVLQANAYLELIKNWNSKQSYSNKVKAINRYAKLVGNAESAKLKKSEDQAVKAIKNKALSSPDHDAARVRIVVKTPDKDAVNQLIASYHVTSQNVAVLSQGKITFYTRTTKVNDPRNTYQPNTDVATISGQSTLSAGSYTLYSDSLSGDDSSVLITDTSNKDYGKVVNFDSDETVQQYLGSTATLSDAQNTNQTFKNGAAYVWLANAGLNGDFLLKGTNNTGFVGTSNENNNSEMLILDQSAINSLLSGLNAGTLIVK